MAPLRRYVSRDLRPAAVADLRVGISRRACVLVPRHIGIAGFLNAFGYSLELPFGFKGPMLRSSG